MAKKKTRKINRTYVVLKADPVRVKPSYKTKKIATIPVGKKVKATKINGFYIYVPEYKGWTIWQSAKGEKYVKLVAKPISRNADKLIVALKDIAVTLKKYPIKWSNNPGTSTLKATIKKKRINCAAYISYGLQRIKILPSGTTFWLDSKVHGKGTKRLKKKATVTYPKRVPSKAGLRKGDICGFSNKPHTMVYAGKSKHGYPLWYSAGGSDTKPKNYGAKRKKSYENRKVMVRIRLK